eukprot:753945-Hanusia_phi.AAC.9
MPTCTASASSRREQEQLWKIGSWQISAMRRCKLAVRDEEEHENESRGELGSRKKPMLGSKELEQEGVRSKASARQAYVSSLHNNSDSSEMVSRRCMRAWSRLTRRVPFVLENNALPSRRRNCRHLRGRLPRQEQVGMEQQGDTWSRLTSCPTSAAPECKARSRPRGHRASLVSREWQR